MARHILVKTTTGLFAIPLQKVAEHRANQYETPNTPEWQDEVDWVIEDGFKGIDWIVNNTNWSDWKNEVIKIKDSNYGDEKFWSTSDSFEIVEGDYVKCNQVENPIKIYINRIIDGWRFSFKLFEQERLKEKYPNAICFRSIEVDSSNTPPSYSDIKDTLVKQIIPILTGLTPVELYNEKIILTDGIKEFPIVF